VIVRELVVAFLVSEVRQLLVKWNFTDCTDRQQDEYNVDNQHDAEYNLPQNTLLNPLDSKGNYSATSNNTKLVHWLLMGKLLHLVQRGCGPALATHPSTVSVPITVLL